MTVSIGLEWNESVHFHFYFAIDHARMKLAPGFHIKNTTTNPKACSSLQQSVGVPPSWCPLLPLLPLVVPYWPPLIPKAIAPGSMAAWALRLRHPTFHWLANPIQCQSPVASNPGKYPPASCVAQFIRRHDVRPFDDSPGRCCNCCFGFCRGADGAMGWLRPLQTFQTFRHCRNGPGMAKRKVSPVAAHRRNSKSTR